MYDAHTHISEELLQYCKDNSLVVCWNTANKEEYEKVKNQPIFSFGIHPWNADKYEKEEAEKLLQKAVIVGEIGMDNVWCNIDEATQEYVFRQQLEFANKQNKPVVLHTKGYEKKIIEIIKEYPNTYQVHWFADIHTMDEYVLYGSYFSIGPAVLIDEDIQQIAKKAPIDRVLVESDGINALSWLFNKDISIDEYYAYMEKTYCYLAKQYGLSVIELKQQVAKNYRMFLGKTL